MTVCAFERQESSEEHEIKHLIRRVAQQIEKDLKIPQEFFNPEEDTKLNEELTNKESAGIYRKEILEKALEQVKRKRGIFPNKNMERIYIDIITEKVAREIAKKIQAGEDKYKLLREYGVRTKRKKGVNLGERIEEKVDQFLKI